MEQFVSGLPYTAAFDHPKGGKWSVTFYGDETQENAWMIMSMDDHHPRQANLADCQVVAMGRKFLSPKSTKEAERIMRSVAQHFVQLGWSWADAVEGLPDTGSYLDNVGADVARAEGFHLVLEKPGTRPVFDEQEISAMLYQARQIFEGEI